MSRDKLNAYQATQKRQQMTPRQAEAMAFIKAAAMMEDAKRTPKDKALFLQALRFNQLFWTILQADITDPKNELPDPIKANIMSLSIFVDKQTGQAIRSEDPKDLDVLISINRNLAAGLNDQTGDAPAAAGAAVSAGGSATV